jgi:hypothetical protein
MKLLHSRVFAALVIALAIVFFGLTRRFEFVTSNGSGFLIDRLTGKVRFCDQSICRELERP